MTRTKCFNIKISNREYEMMKEIAEREELTMSELIRTYIRMKHRELFNTI